MTSDDRIDLECFYKIAKKMFPEVPRQQAICMFLNSVYSKKEVSKMMNRSVNTIKNNARMGRNRVKEEVNTSYSRSGQIFLARLKKILIELD